MMKSVSSSNDLGISDFFYNLLLFEPDVAPCLRHSLSHLFFLYGENLQLPLHFSPTPSELLSEALSPRTLHHQYVLFGVIAELLGGHPEGHRFGRPVHLFFKILRKFLGPYHSEPPRRPSFQHPSHPSDEQVFLETTLECRAFESLWLIHLSRPACGLRFSEGHTHSQRALSLLLHPQCLHSLLVHHWCLRSQPSLLSDNASMVTLPKYRPLWP